MATLQTLVRGRGYDASQGIIEEVTKSVPELQAFDAILIPGTTFQSVSLTFDPTTGFRAVGAGIDASDEGYALRTYKTSVLAGLVQRDKAAFDADIRGRDTALLAAAIAVVRSGMKTLGKAVWYGDSTSQFDGASATDNVVNAGGSTANAESSAFAVGIGEDKCHLVFNESSGLLTASELSWKEGVATGSNNKTYPTYWTDLTCWAGFACRNANAIARLANLDASAHKLTDEKLAELVATYMKFNDDQRPDAIFCSFAQRLLLQKSRGTTVRTTARSTLEITAGVPLEYDGIPIYATAGIVDTEAVWTLSSSSSMDFRAPSMVGKMG